MSVVIEQDVILIRHCTIINEQNQRERANVTLALNDVSNKHNVVFLFLFCARAIVTHDNRFFRFLISCTPYPVSTKSLQSRHRTNDESMAINNQMVKQIRQRIRSITYPMILHRKEIYSLCLYKYSRETNRLHARNERNERFDP